MSSIQSHHLTQYISLFASVYIVIPTYELTNLEFQMTISTLKSKLGGIQLGIQNDIQLIEKIYTKKSPCNNKTLINQDL